MALARGQTVGRATSTATSRTHHVAGGNDLGHARNRVARVTASALPTLHSPAYPGASVSGSAASTGPYSAPGGPYLYDRQGRIVFFHGVNAVYKHPPYELFPAPGKPWNLSAADASLMARLGFNVVRLGMTWSGLEPGTAPANDPAICGPGRPSDPHQFNQAIFDRYVARLRTTVNLLGRFHIHVILDMHQDVYNQMFDGEGAPSWAVCTDGVPSVDVPGRWSFEYATKAAGIAFHHFWANDVRGDLQGEYDRVWGDVARSFRSNPWILGYDPFNEPFSKSLVRFGDEHFDAQLECFYTGTADVGAASHGAPPLRCPPADPTNGVVPTLLANDPSHLIFDEPDNYASRGFPTYLGSMNLRHLVFNVHLYCGARSPVTGNPTDLTACARQEAHSLRVRAEDRSEMSSGPQPGGPPWLVSEFGAVQQPRAPREHHGEHGRAPGRVGLLVLEVLQRSDGEHRRVARDGRRPPPLDGARAEPHVPRGGRRRADLIRLLALERSVPPGLRAQPPYPCTLGHLRGHGAALPAGLLRPYFGCKGDFSAGQ